MPERPILLAHPSSAEHDTGDHPENIGRIVAVISALQQQDYLGYHVIGSPEIDRTVLERIHPASYIDSIARVSERGGGALDPDTILSEGSYRAALHSAGGAVEMVRRLVADGAGAVGFSAHRPPGHHAPGDKAMGFCLFNNVALAAQYALDTCGLDRVMILDWDVHHGNGTQDIFWESDQVLFVSIHQWPLYPGSGRPTEVGEGAGQGYTVNLPVPPTSGDEEYVSLVRDVFTPLARLYRPQLLLVSAGYDAHRDDPLADCLLSDEGYTEMATIVRRLADELEVPVGGVLEGGYDLGALSRGVLTTMSMLAAPAPAEGAGGQRAAVPTSELATAAIARLSSSWPELSSQV